MCCSFGSFLRGWLKVFHYLFAVNGAAWIFVGVWVLVETEGTGFGFAIFICALYATALGIWGVYTISQRSQRRLLMWAAFFLPFLLLQIAILFAWIITPQPLFLAIERSAGVSRSDRGDPVNDPMNINNYLTHHKPIVTVFSILGVVTELCTFTLAVMFRKLVIVNELDDLIDDDPILKQRQDLAAKGLLPEQQPRHAKTSRAREKLNEKYGGGFSKPVNSDGTGEYQSLSNSDIERTKTSKGRRK